MQTIASSLLHSQIIGRMTEFMNGNKQDLKNRMVQANSHNLWNQVRTFLITI